MRDVPGEVAYLKLTFGVREGWEPAALLLLLLLEGREGEGRQEGIV